MNVYRFLSITLSRPLLGLTLVGLTLLGVLGPEARALSHTPSTKSPPGKITRPSPSVSPTGVRLGYPGRRIGGGTRSQCGSAIALTSIAPSTHLILTTSPQPTLLFHLANPSQANSIHPDARSTSPSAAPPSTAPKIAEFVLRDAQDREVYSTMLEIPAGAELVSLDLGAIAASGLAPAKTLASQSEPSLLVLDQDYRWYFSILCSPDNRAADIGVEGWLRRVAAPASLKPTLPSVQPSVQDPLKQAQTLQELGFKHDALVLLSELRGDSNLSPSLRQTAQQQWEELLCHDEVLEPLAKAPMAVKVLTRLKETDVRALGTAR